VTFSRDKTVTEIVIKTEIQLHGFPNQDVIVKDLILHACISEGMCVNILDYLSYYYYCFRRSIFD